MKAGTVIKIVITVIAVGLCVFVGLIYFAFQPKTTDVSELPPYAQLIDQTVSLETSAVIVKNLEEFSYETPFLLLKEGEPLFEGVEPLYPMKKGHLLTITGAKHYRNTVSGFTSSIIIGTTYIPELDEDLTFEYHWGEQVITLDPDEPLSFAYPLALWQKQPLGESFSFD